MTGRGRRTRVVAAVASALPLLISASCGSDQSGAGDKSTLTVLAASSLTEVFTELAETFEQDHPGVDVTLTFDSSSTLAEQVVQGAPADVLATADEATMADVTDEGLAATEPVAFAQNVLVLATPPDDPGGVAKVTDLGDDVAYAVCVPEAPCGAASAELLGIVGVHAEPVTEEDNVRDVLTKITAGEVDAGLVYASDAQAAGSDVRVVPVRAADRVLNSDVVAPLSDAADADLAREWVDLVTSETGQQVLSDAGFLPAP